MLQPSGFDYFYGQQAESYTFYRIPKVMFTEERFKNLSCEAKVLYGLMLDRMSLSTKNGWLDEEGRVYIVFPLIDIRELIRCSKQTAVNLVHELDTEQGIGLIEKSRPGMGKANVFYVKNYTVIAVRTEFEKVLMEKISLRLFYFALLRHLPRGSFPPLFFPSFPFLSFLLPLERREKERTKEKENKDVLHYG